MGGGGIHSIVPTYLMLCQIEESTRSALPNLVGDIDSIAIGPTWGCMLTHDKWQFKYFNAVYAP